jgi:hypothetical protein
LWFQFGCRSLLWLRFRLLLNAAEGQSDGEQEEENNIEEAKEVGERNGETRTKTGTTSLLPSP